MPTVPVIDRRILEALLETELLRSGPAPGLVLVHGSYDGPAEFPIRVGDSGRRRVRVTDQPSVLGVVDAWQRHQMAMAATPPDDRLLVVTTTAADHQLGSDVRGHALGRKTLNVDTTEIIRRRFGAAALDPRIRREGWLVEALLAAEPPGGWRDSDSTALWRRSGGVLLTYDAAVRTLAAVRFGTPRVLDADTLLGWSRSPAGPDRFAELPDAEREGLTTWLRRTAGEPAGVVLALAEASRAADAMALGVIAAILTEPTARADSAVAVGGLFGSVAGSPDDLRAFSVAVQGTLTRWISEAETKADRAERREADVRVKAVLARADELASQAGLSAALADNPFLPSGFRTRLHALANALGRSTSESEAALSRLTDHRLSRLRDDRCQVARMAVRIRRWLDEDSPTVTSVAVGVREHLASLGWADRALAVLWPGDPEQDPIAGRAYQILYEAARARRSTLDRMFADRLADWVSGASTTAPGGCLLIEEVLQQVVAPLAVKGPPLILVLDGMSSAVAAELGEQLAHQSWIEATTTPGLRRAAVSMIPSLTVVSRASLLTGAPATGGQSVESAGFAAFWKRHRRESALFHKSAIAGTAGKRLADAVLDALSRDLVVGVVLNTIDDALDHGREGLRADWQLKDVTYLAELLDAARAYRRPVVLVSDHGHVLDRTEPGSGPTRVSSVGAARWRTGTPADGEVELAGPRVLEGNGTVVVPWREEIRYTPRKDGYHGGAALAEMTVPVLVVLPAEDLVPAGWSVLAPDRTAPAWWKPGAPAGRPQIAEADTAPGELFSIPTSLGSTVVDSPRYTEQRKYVRKAPESRQVAAVIDALVDAGGTLSPAAVNAAAGAAGGRAPRSAELFVTTLQRLLNVEGYQVVALVDAGRTVRLDEQLLAEQFGLQGGLNQ